MRGLVLIIAFAIVVSAACNRESKASAAPSAPHGANAAGAQAVDLGEGVTACEVEMSGRVDQIVSGNRAIIIYTAIGNCLLPNAQIIERTGALGDGVYFTEVFVPCGTKLSLCASIERKVNPKKVPLPTKRYGKLERELLAVGAGEIEFMQLNISLADGPERTFPTPSRVMQRPADRPVNPHPLRGKTR